MRPRSRCSALLCCSFQSLPGALGLRNRGDGDAANPRYDRREGARHPQIAPHSSVDHERVPAWIEPCNHAAHRAQAVLDGEANGRALAYLAHRYLGDVFGSIYDLSTISILWFAGASAMAGLLNIVPRYLSNYGMATEWARASRPLVLVFSLIAVVVTVIFKASVEARSGAGAYAAGVLVLMASAAIAVTVPMRRGTARLPFYAVSAVFVYTTALNIFERPEGIKIASFFILLTVIASLVSRALRATGLLITEVILDDAAKDILSSDSDQLIRIVAHRPNRGSVQEYDRKEVGARQSPQRSRFCFWRLPPTARRNSALRCTSNPA